VRIGHGEVSKAQITINGYRTGVPIFIAVFIDKSSDFEIA
jgi:hypothetical protein